MSQAHSGSTLTWPPERFFWAVIEAPGIRAGVVPSGLEQALQDDLPVPVEEVHAVGSPLTDGRLLVCAASRQELESVAPEVLSLRAAFVPSLEHTSGELAPPEMLVAAMEPSVLRRERSRRSVVLAASILLTSALLSVGLLRRAQNLSDEASAARSATAAAIQQVTTGNNPLSLQRDLQQLRTSKSPTQPLAPSDAATTLAALLSAWPKGVECDTSTVSITPTTLSLSLTVAGDTRPLLAALKAPNGWRLEEPRLNTSGSSTRISLTLKRVDGGKR